MIFHFLSLSHCLPLPTDGPNSSALGGETRASCDGSPAAELWSRCEHPGQPRNHGPDVRLREGPHTHRKAAAGEEPVWPHPDWQGDTAETQSHGQFTSNIIPWPLDQKNNKKCCLHCNCHYCAICLVLWYWLFMVIILYQGAAPPLDDISERKSLYDEILLHLLTKNIYTSYLLFYSHNWTQKGA